MKRADPQRLTVQIATLPAAYKDGWSFAPGAFSWTVDGHQWVPILPAHNRTAMPLGKARVYEDGTALYAELVFNLETKVLRNWCRKLPRDPAKALEVLQLAYGVNAFRKDEAKRVVTHVDVLGLSVSLGSASKHWPASPLPQEDPAWETIAAAIDAAAREQDRS